MYLINVFILTLLNIIYLCLIEFPIDNTNSKDCKVKSEDPILWNPFTLENSTVGTCNCWKMQLSNRMLIT